MSLFKTIVKLAYWCLALLIITIAYLIIYYSNDLPDIKKLSTYQPSLISRIYTKNGNVISEHAKEKRIYLPINKIPKTMINAILAAEDQNFYSHPGVDVTGIFRALITNIQGRHGKNFVGGSTITQQLVKNLLLTNEQSIARKIKEALLSFQISNIYSKDKILELYLNQVYLGGGAYGVGYAAFRYFGKELENLTIDEFAFLAGMLQAPSLYSNNIQKAEARRNYVLSRMVDEGFLSREEGNILTKKPLKFNEIVKQYFIEGEYFISPIKREIEVKYGEEFINDAGLTIISSIDEDYQKIARQVFYEGLFELDKLAGYRGPIDNINIKDIKNELSKIKIPKGMKKTWQIGYVEGYSSDNSLNVRIILSDKAINIEQKFNNWVVRGNKTFKSSFKIGDIILFEKLKENYIIRQIPEVQGAILVQDIHNGKILAMEGGFSYAESSFNRAIQAKRQPGSSIKPFIYLAALEAGYSPTLILNDSPISLQQSSKLSLWQPKNWSNDYWGPITFRRGLEFSRNTISVRLGQLVGVKRISKLLNNLEIINKKADNLSVVLGSYETSLLRLISAYSTIISGGKKVTPSFIDKIIKPNGETLSLNESQEICLNCNADFSYEGDEEVEIKDKRPQILDENIAFQVNYILQGAVERGLARSLKKDINNNNIKFGAKTGTSNDAKDIWFFAYNPDIIVGIYFGYDKPKTLGDKIYGATHAIPPVRSFYEKIIQKNLISEGDFHIPKGIKFMNINYKTGKIVDDDDLANYKAEEIIKEAFVEKE